MPITIITSIPPKCDRGRLRRKEKERKKDRNIGIEKAKAQMSVNHRYNF